jgi:hypothetical protein
MKKKCILRLQLGDSLMFEVLLYSSFELAAICSVISAALISTILATFSL